MNRLFLALPALPLLLAGCKIGPDFEPPKVHAPTAFHAGSAVPAPDAAPVNLARWWEGFGDPVLTARVRRSLTESPGAKAARARLEQARNLTLSARAGLWPIADANGSYFLLSDRSQPGPLFSNPTTSIPVDVPAVSWDTDLFGQTRRGVESSKAQSLGAMWQLFAVNAALAADTARQELLARGLGERLRIARLNIDAQAETLRLAESRYQAGLSTEAPVAQARAQLAGLQANLPDLEEAKSAAEHRLAVLMGAAPGSLRVDGHPLAQVPVPPAGLPIEVIRRRPDVAVAESALRDLTAQIGVVEAELYPRLSFTGGIRASVDSPDDLFEGASYNFSFGPSVRWRLFDRTRIQYRVKAAGFAAEAALHDFDATVLAALEEVENALVALLRGAERLRLLADARAQAERSVAVARAQYEQGLGDFSVVLTEQQRLFSIRSSLAEAETRQALNTVGLYQALGAGWELPEEAKDWQSDLELAAPDPMHASDPAPGVPPAAVPAAPAETPARP